MTGMSNAAELAAVGARVASTLYLRLLKDTSGDPDQLILDGNHQLNDDGTFPTGLAEVVAAAGGYAPMELLTTKWSTPALEGPLAVVQAPKTGDPALTFAAVGGDMGNIVGWALTTTTAAITSANLMECGRLVDTLGADTWVPLTDGGTLEWTVAKPLKLRQGDPGDYA